VLHPHKATTNKERKIIPLYHTHLIYKTRFTLLIIS